MKNTLLAVAPEYRGFNIITVNEVKDLTEPFERNDFIVLDGVNIPDFPYDYWMDKIPTLLKITDGNRQCFHVKY